MTTLSLFLSKALTREKLKSIPSQNVGFVEAFSKLR
jgi:hypothetical protein